MVLMVPDLVANQLLKKPGPVLNDQKEVITYAAICSRLHGR